MFRLTRLHVRPPALSRGSHIGAAPIPIPPDLKVALASENALTIAGPRGSTSVPLPSFISLSLSPYTPSKSNPYQTSSSGLCTPNPAPSSTPIHALELAIQKPENKVQRATWGLTRALIANAVTGISRGFNVELNLVGVGYRAVLEPDPSKEGERIALKLGFAHWIYVPIPAGITAKVPLPTRIVLSGNDKHQLGQFAANIREWRKPEPYKGKGIFVGGETIKLKDVKKK
ncbi:ribosomal protein L6 [Ceratobasidium sp. AG-Ba]|nr:ribosomal protein L6 [Ceratobasidium sp. AG-Ba]QRW06780.1 ribosomal protein L6 [Ceratobasidium sp. AG-Ba]